TVGSTISRTIPIQTRCRAPGRALELNSGNTTPAAMNPHDAQVPKARSCARWLFKRSGISGGEIVMLATLSQRRSLREPSAPPRQTGQRRRRDEDWLVTRTPAIARPEAPRRLSPAQRGLRYRARSRLV